MLRLPNKIDFNITNYCNSKCATCARFKPDENLPYHLAPNLQVKHMDYNKFASIVDANKQWLSGKIIQFCGEFGDAFMHPQLPLFTRKITNNLEVHTNGGINRFDYVDECIDYENVDLYFAIDGLSHEVNNIYRKGVNTRLAFENMLHFAKWTNRCTWNYIVFPHNIHEIEDAIKFSLDNNIKISIKFNTRDTFLHLGAMEREHYDAVREIVSRYEVEHDRM